MTFFAVEVDYFHQGDHESSVLVPRTAFVPSWVADGPLQGGRPRRTTKVTIEQAPQPARGFLEHMNDFARQHAVIVTPAKNGFAYRPRKGKSGVGVYFLTSRGVEFNLNSFRTRGDHEFADQFLAKLREVSGENVIAPEWPAVPIESLAHDWERTRRELMEPYFEARLAHYSDAADGG